MKVFWIKLTGVAIAAFMLFSYQSQARILALLDSVIDEKEQQVTEEPVNESGQSEYKDGTYTGTGTGYSGKLTVQVTIKDGAISEIEITDTTDDKAYLSMATDVIDSIIEEQKTEGVDTVSGATYSSQGILEAVENALTESRN